MTYHYDVTFEFGNLVTKELRTLKEDVVITSLMKPTKRSIMEHNKYHCPSVYGDIMWSQGFHSMRKLHPFGSGFGGVEVKSVRLTKIEFKK